MAKFDRHPTVRWWREQAANNRSTSRYPGSISANQNLN
jgi:hypothetical protein